MKSEAARGSGLLLLMNKRGGKPRYRRVSWLGARAGRAEDVAVHDPQRRQPDQGKKDKHESAQTRVGQPGRVRRLGRAREPGVHPCSHRESERRDQDYYQDNHLNSRTRGWAARLEASASSQRLEPAPRKTRARPPRGEREGAEAERGGLRANQTTRQTPNAYNSRFSLPQGCPPGLQYFRAEGINTWSQDRVVLGVEAPMTLPFSIALSAGMVAATLVPPIRRLIPRPVEVLIWLIFAFVCVIGVMSITNPNARDLTTSAVWGVGQVINTFIGLLIAGAMGWVAEQRFVIATWLVLLCGADILALTLLRSHRKAQRWQPRVRLGEWMELPRLAPAMQRVDVPYALDGANRWLAAAMAVGAAALLTWLVNFLIWARDVLVPREARRLAHAAAASRVQSRAGLEALRDNAAQFHFAARSRYTAAGRSASGEGIG